uniref:ATP synthase mitochondrial F1 complex assembly factor 1 n=1 Tax=Xiphophorus couchianus TaxID=32473 RepID=A0A3B5L7V5_9TELE
MSAALIQMSCLYRGMLAVRAIGTRTLIPGLVPEQFRAFSVRKDPELVENPFYNKYQDKIQKLRSAKPQEYKERLEKRHEAKKDVLGHSKQAEFVQLMEQERPLEGFICKSQNSSRLNFYLLLFQLWMQFYSTKDTISAAIPVNFSFLPIVLSWIPCSPLSVCSLQFLYALPQKEGYEFFVGQWSRHELHFTSLINIQTLSENAPSQLILYHYPELKEEKGIVLMTAEMDPKFITVHQAQCLANQVQLFYGTQKQETYRLVETLNHQPEDFKHMSVIAELEQTTIFSVSAK